ncbi:phosphoribosylaminoimidazolesuccinocarboxamide synthase [Candidatus Peribacteria bacterium]|jgi:phosphoribosylaminoimidazole-succinocarboxamide synthase|nr:phosphoribosylaminoimidazolesuccinocarboxamide synthase [Candidatus Peribacteria bacterium]MBT4021241.1 phosphoribosylaminoimidazolesuccinocarboxamide synthase [Candidatus Peribacteria bacterium]MBT4240524.1 phosphoribosylaminoimidazolesuccinocarboxamide synthase [Candidatus Peribacteria bacterium]MBT4473970.1 phosphoribosylaminoimidazolesuccinocarboxamide synthase [Candidatus Peribacteria bacterium]
MVTSDQISKFLTNTVEKTDFQGIGDKYEGKVRDVYTSGDKRILIATDRQSAFDISWCTIPLKGQVLNQLSAWWFEQISDVMPTQVVSVPDPNVMVVKNLKMVPVEIVVRAYLTGSTQTSAWVNYKNGMRKFCGNDLPDGMVKNQKLEEIIITPTTKAEEDELIDAEGIVSQGLATQEQWDEITEKAFALFKKGQEIAADKGLILVDTKYEMGYDEDGKLTIADEVHTPDSSRYWKADTYEEKFANGEEPEALDKEFFRLWLREQGFEYGKEKPEITDEVRVMLAGKYIDLYERMTGKEFEVEEEDVIKRIESNLK